VSGAAGAAQVSGTGFDPAADGGGPPLRPPAIPERMIHGNSAELIVRKLRGINDATATVPRITQHLRLPAFRYSGRDPYSWPRT
jgi:hypothetical protein